MIYKLKKYLIIFLRDRKIVFNIISFLIDIYSYTTALIENKIFRKNNSDKKFNELGYLKIKSKRALMDRLDLIKEIFKSLKDNPNALNKKQLEIFLFNLFNKSFRDEITKITGFEYSVDYFKVIYNNRSSINKGAPIPHFDKSFSKNMLKIFIPLRTTDLSGPLKFYNKKDSKYIKKGFLRNNFQKVSMFGDGEFIYGLKANECFHEVTIPEESFSSINIMLQLNPSSKWGFRNDLSELQFSGEPKFTSFTFLIAKKTFF